MDPAGSFSQQVAKRRFLREDVALQRELSDCHIQS